MKILFVTALLFGCSVAFAQTQTTATRKTMTGAEFAKMMPKVTDPNVYDRYGKVLDSAEVKMLVKTFEWGVGRAIPEGQTEYKSVLIKVDLKHQAESDRATRLQFRPASPKLWEGVTLDLSPLAQRTDLAKLQGKAVVLIFWIDQYAGNLYGKVNEVIADYIGTHKFEVFAITHHPYDIAIPSFKKNPILNAHNVFDAQSIVDFYGTDNKAVVVVTNAQHQVTFAITGHAAMTPRTLNKLLKEL
jgi:hypothetical protein